MRNVARQLTNPRKNTVVNPNNVGGLQNSGTKYGLPRNSYTDCMNIILGDRGKFKRRRSAYQLGVEPDSSSAPVYGVGYSVFHDTWIRVKGTNIQTLSSENATWTTIASYPALQAGDEVQIINFRATQQGGLVINGTLAEDDNERYIISNTQNMTPNVYTGRFLKIGDEIKMIVGNEDKVIYIQGRFEKKYTSGTSYQIVHQTEAVYIVAPQRQIRIWRGGTNIQTLNLGIDTDRAVVQSYGANNNLGRLLVISMGDSEQKVYISEMGTGEYFAQDSFIPLSMNGKLRHISENRGQVIVYSEYGRATIAGDNPDNYFLKEAEGYKGTISSGSVAQGTNLELYLSHEGVEYRQSLEEATVTSGISRSDSIKKLLDRHTDFSKSKGAISDGRYYLSIEDMVYIYDFEKSVRFQKPIFTVAQYTECSTAGTGYAWTYATEVLGELVFAQGGRVYRLKGEKIGQNLPQVPMEYWIEFPIEHFNEYRLDKSVQKICTYFQKNTFNSFPGAITRFRVYVRYDEGPYELVREVENIYEIESFTPRRCNNIQIKVVIQDMHTVVDEDIEFQENVIYFSGYGKK